MFTRNTIALSTFEAKFGLSVVRDCLMSFVGKIPTDLENRIVPCGTSRHIAEALQEDGIIGIITKPEFSDMVPESIGLAVCEEPRASAYMLHEHLCAMTDFIWESFDSQIDPTAEIHSLAVIASKDVVIGPNCRIEAFAVIKERSLIGSDCRIGSHCVIGSDAFEVDGDSEYPRILAQAGGVMIDDNVELLSHCVIARSAFGGFTKIGAGSKIDCLVLITHDVKLGQKCQVAAGAIVCGRAVIGDHAFLGPQSVVSNGVIVNEGASVSIGAVVASNVRAGLKVTGNFAVPHAKWMKFMGWVAR